jgi:hypothetical protein
MRLYLYPPLIRECFIDNPSHITTNTNFNSCIRGIDLLLSDFNRRGAKAQRKIEPPNPGELKIAHRSLMAENNNQNKLSVAYELPSGFRFIIGQLFLYSAKAG